MPRYFVRFKANHANGQATEHTRMIDMPHPIEYDSDIKMIQEWAAKQVDTLVAVLVDWKELKGAVRPEN